MQDWKKHKLGEIALLKRGYDLPDRLREKGNYQIISSSGVTDTHIEYKVEGPGVVTGRYGTIGKVFYTTKNFWPLNTSLYVKDFMGNDSKFIYYLLQTINWQSYSTKSAVPGIDRNEVHQEMVVVPPLQEQENIASILSAFDDKIELNLQMNKTLEEMAMALYKHWFVDFGPFQNGKFVESELGMIPEGWEVKSINSFGKIVCGKTPSKKDENNFSSGQGYPFIKIPDMHGKVFVFETLEKISKQGNKLQLNKLLPAGSVNISCIATVGLVTINSLPAHTNQQINSIIPDYSSFKYYLYISMLNLKDRFMNEASGGSATLNMNTSTFSSIEILKPLNTELKEFDLLVSNLFEQINQNAIENQTLTTLRDTLLPKLISGEVRVKDAKQMVATAL